LTSGILSGVYRGEGVKPVGICPSGFAKGFPFEEFVCGGPSEGLNMKCYYRETESQNYASA